MAAANRRFHILGARPFILWWRQHQSICGGILDQTLCPAHGSVLRDLHGRHHFVLRFCNPQLAVPWAWWFMQTQYCWVIMVDVVMPSFDTFSYLSYDAWFAISFEQRPWGKHIPNQPLRSWAFQLTLDFIIVILALTWRIFHGGWVAVWLAEIVSLWIPQACDRAVISFTMHVFVWLNCFNEVMGKCSNQNRVMPFSRFYRIRKKRWTCESVWVWVCSQGDRWR